MLGWTSMLHVIRTHQLQREWGSDFSIPSFLDSSGLSKLVGTQVHKQMTIRNVNTARKIYELMRAQVTCWDMIEGGMSMTSESTSTNGKVLSPEQQAELLGILKARFEQNMNRHEGMKWSDVQARLEAHPDKLWSLHEMEKTGGEPDVVDYDHQTGEYIFFDCSPESPKGRRSVCYDREALESRKKHKPENSAVDMANAMGIELLTEDEYRKLQTLGQFDTKTSSWVKTPEKIRKLGGALFCDRRYDTVFVYHNGAESYYAARGFRGSLRV